MKSRYFIKVVACILTLSFLLESTAVFALPGPADTIPPVPTSDAALRQKEVGITVLGITTPGVTLDSIMIHAVREIIDKLSDSVIDWINSGFEEGPAFVVDPQNYFLDLADGVGGSFVESIGGSGLCSPFKIKIETALRLNNLRTNSHDPYEASCDISDIVDNVGEFIDGNFLKGGWEGWFSLVLNPQNNPYGAYLDAQSELLLRTNLAQEEALLELDWGRGFLSTADCIKRDSNETCVQFGETKTPGALIEGQLQKVFGSEVDQLNLADEFDEILGALMGQLTDMVFNQNGVFDGKGNTVNRNRNSGRNADRNTFGACFADTSEAFVDEDVLWTFSGQVSDNMTFQWNLGDGKTATGNPVTTTYQNQGDKRASVTVTRTTIVSTSTAPVVNTTTIACTGAVTVRRYRPLALDCSVEPRTLSRGQIGTWTIKITGGSGQLRRVDLSEEKTYNNNGDTFPNEWNLLASVTPQFFLSAFQPDATGIFDGNPIPWVQGADGSFTMTLQVRYMQSGSWGLEFDSIVDLDQYVDALVDVSCPNSNITVVGG